MELVRRLPKAALVTVLALLFFGGTTGLVAASGQPELPASFGVPMPQQGDQWAYELWAEVEGPGDVELSQEELGFEWLAPEVMQDRAGRWHVVHPLLERNGSRDDWSALLVDAATGHSVGHRSQNQSAGSSIFGGVMGVGSSSEIRSDRAVTTTFESYPMPCGFRSDLQGATLPLDRAVRFVGLCGLELQQAGLGMPFGAEDKLWAKRIDTVDGVSAVLFEGGGRQAAPGGAMDLEVQLWMSPAIPYPVRAVYRFDIAFSFEGQEERFRIEMGMRMTGYERGSGWAGLAVPTASVPMIAMAPRQPWGPDDSGIDMPFRAREAWEMLMADSEAGAWLEDHDEAHAVRGEYTQVEYEDRIERTWSMLLAEDRDGAQVEVTQVQWNEPARELLESLGGDQAGPADRVAMIEFDLDDDIDLPDHLPTVRSLQARWASMQFPPGQANAYGFEACLHEGCASPMDVLAGRVEGRDDAPTVSNPAVPDDGTFTQTRHMLRVDASGQPLALEESEQEGRRRGGLLGSMQTTTEAAAMQPSVAASLAAPWVFPSAPAAASVAAGAFLVGLLYWLWPVVKSGGAMGLFSRIQRDAVLEHPVRRSIHEAVQANPGVHYQQLIRMVGKGRGTVEHHIRKLQDGGYLVSHRNAGHTCFFVKGAMDHSVMAAVPAIRTQAAARVLALIQGQPGIRSSDVAARLGLARSTASHHVRRLKEAGLVEEAGGALLPSRLAQPALAAVA